MCDGCRDDAEDYVLDLVEAGYPLDIAIRLTRDTAVQRGLASPTVIDSLGALQKLSDDITEAGERLTERQRQLVEDLLGGQP